VVLTGVPIPPHVLLLSWVLRAHDDERRCRADQAARTDNAIAAVAKALACEQDLVDEIDAEDDLRSLGERQV
jgi:hypothetical protein